MPTNPLLCIELQQQKTIEVLNIKDSQELKESI